MSTVEQIHHLEQRIDRMLSTLRELRTANESLRGDLAVSEERAAELQRQLTDSESARQEADRTGEDLRQQLGQLHAEQEEIEATITRTLDQLGKLDIGAAVETADAAPAADSGPAAYADEPEYSEAEAEAGDPEDEAAPDDEPVLLQDDDHDLPEADEPEGGEPETAEPAVAEADVNGGNRGGDDLDIF
jgi:chromosome segregation ATPase